MREIAVRISQYGTCILNEEDTITLKHNGENMIDVTDELIDLKKGYERALEQEHIYLDASLANVVHCTKALITHYDKIRELDNKLGNLKLKMRCNECGESCDGDDE